jgi:hypothetical protein
MLLLRAVQAVASLVRVRCAQHVDDVVSPSTVQAASVPPCRHHVGLSSGASVCSRGALQHGRVCRPDGHACTSAEAPVSCAVGLSGGEGTQSFACHVSMEGVLSHLQAP